MYVCINHSATLSPEIGLLERDSDSNTEFTESAEKIERGESWRGEKEPHAKTQRRKERERERKKKEDWGILFGSDAMADTWYSKPFPIVHLPYNVAPFPTLRFPSLLSLSLSLRLCVFA
jgi:hypothetical protein